MLAVPVIACDDAPPMCQNLTYADILTSARMAAGMTSRARRPDTCDHAG
jgi:hypothetical protein